MPRQYSRLLLAQTTCTTCGRIFDFIQANSWSKPRYCSLACRKKTKLIHAMHKAYNREYELADVERLANHGYV